METPIRELVLRKTARRRYVAAHDIWYSLDEAVLWASADASERDGAKLVGAYQLYGSPRRERDPTNFFVVDVYLFCVDLSSTGCVRTDDISIG